MEAEREKKSSDQRLTTLALVPDTGYCSILPPVNRGRKVTCTLMNEPSSLSWSMEHPVVANLWASIVLQELMDGHISKPIQFQLVRLVLAIHLVNMFQICLEYIEALLFFSEAAGNCVLTPPSLSYKSQSLSSDATSSSEKSKLWANLKTRTTENTTRMTFPVSITTVSGTID